MRGKKYVPFTSENKQSTSLLTKHDKDRFLRPHNSNTACDLRTENCYTLNRRDAKEFSSLGEGFRSSARRNKILQKHYKSPNDR